MCICRYLLYVKKHQIGQILVSKETDGSFSVHYYEVIRATSRTCELRELKKEITSQMHDEQEVRPIPGDYISLAFRRKINTAGAVEISENLYAWPWTGTSLWQPAIIFLP